MEKCFPCLDLCRLAALHTHFAELLLLDDPSSGGGKKLLSVVAAKCVEGKDVVSDGKKFLLHTSALSIWYTKHVGRPLYVRTRAIINQPYTVFFIIHVFPIAVPFGQSPQKKEKGFKVFF